MERGKYLNGSSLMFNKFQIVFVKVDDNGKYVEKYH